MSTKYYELTEDEKSFLNEDDRKTYEKAIELCHCEDACGPFGGWADGHDMLLKIGWKKEEYQSGHRTYVRLVKPITPIEKDR